MDVNGGVFYWLCDCGPLLMHVERDVVQVVCKLGQVCSEEFAMPSGWLRLDDTFLRFKGS